ncbi:hypothetical protein PIROE2DRAFT_7576 [Piromyces sp. E2]|nr:hypothetical protein PIROE2DRAFT_7576 [Piromyces sp. E2]|eukprot:OUM65459.1 hypothetical protein PIROE2DRAFT_7576 [Piromyces sp. E2]
MLLIIYFLVSFVIIINALEISVQDEKQLRDGLMIGSEKDLVLKIEKGIIEISKELEIQHNYKSLSIRGIEVVNDNVEKKYIQFRNFEYHAAVKEGSTKNNCIELYGEVEIIGSEFYSSPSSCIDGIINYHGNNVNSIVISTSYFDGAYYDNCLSIQGSEFTSIEFSIFERGASYENHDGGGAIRIKKSNVNISDCQFKDNFSLKKGGALSIYDTSFSANNINFVNSTALEKGSLIYMHSSEFHSAYISNINCKDSGNINNINDKDLRGLIASVEGYSTLIIDNLYGENLYGGSKSGAFTLNQQSVIEVR